MEIKKEDQYVSIPREQYEEMEKIVNNKSDIDVRFQLFYNDGFSYIRGASTLYVMYDHVSVNSNFGTSKLFKLRGLITSACEKITKVKDQEIESLQKELKLITHVKTKWWYKLFTYFGG